MNSYKRLNKYYVYDIEAARELAMAMTELREIEQRAKYLNSLILDNPELRPFVWTTAEGKSMALQDIKDDHFKNILSFIVAQNKDIPPSLVEEAKKRGVPLPDSPESAHRALVAAEAEIIPPKPSDDDEFINLDDIPF